ncbi:hypothetical protein INT48_000856 [Thamnidium elegans]|uniref:Uncharacterized protein n=1 Tax=Thamnidium elegans TaxID=101142 RepID=A0A8H7VW12_9FUNG|nr:hypothetical protein INT48_000856 [Thamnidium elegans]
MDHMLQTLLHIDDSSSTQPQKDLVSRVMTQPCVNTNKMICVIDSMLLNVSQDLIENGVTDASTQLNTQKFDQILSQLLTRLDKHTFAAYIPYVEASKKFQPKENLVETDKEFRTYAKLTQDFYSMLINPTSFSPSDMVSPFIINDASLRKKAIKKLTTSPSFKLQPVETNDHFQDILEKIKEQIMEADTQSNFDGNIILELSSILGLDATPLPELNSTDIANATVIIDQSNATLFTPPSGEDSNKLVLMNAILRSLLGDLLDAILDLPDKIIGSEGGLLGGKGGVTITISLGGKKQGNDKNNNDRNNNDRNNNDRNNNDRNNNDRNYNDRNNNDRNNNDRNKDRNSGRRSPLQ